MADVEPMTNDRSNSEEQNGEAATKDDDSFGISDGRISDSAICSSSALNAACGASQARLNNQPVKEKYGAWSPLFNDKDQYLDVDLGEMVQIGSIATQGRPAFDQDGGWFVQSYSLSSSNDGENFTNLREYGISKVFEGNKDAETVVRNNLKNALKCRYLRIRPVTWHNQIALRIEVYRYTAAAGGQRKRSTHQRSAAKTDRAKPRPGTRGSTTASRMEALQTPQTATQRPAGEPIKMSDKVVNGVNGAVVAAADKNKMQQDQVEIPKGDVYDAVTAEGSVDIVQPSKEVAATEEPKAQSSIQQQQQQQQPQKQQHQQQQQPQGQQQQQAQQSVNMINTAFRSEPRSPQEAASIRDKTDNFEARPALSSVDQQYSQKMRQASAISTTNDGSKYIGRIKLIKKEEPPVEGKAEDEREAKKGIDCEIPEVVKQRVTDFKEVVIREKDTKSNQDLNKRRSVALEDDLSYVKQMEVSMHERLKMFKETESKDKEKIELSKQEEEKRRALKENAEKRRSLAIQKEKERMQALIEKQKEEEEERRRQREISEKESDEEFLEREAEVLPAIVNDRLRLFKENESKEKQEIQLRNEEKRKPVTKDTVDGEFVEINDRLKLFKQTEKQQEEKRKIAEAESEKRRIARENAERKKLLAIQRDKEKLEELMKKQKEEEEIRQKELEKKAALLKETVTEEDEVPAIVRDRLKMFKEGEKANKGRTEALKLEAERRKATKSEAERRRVTPGDRRKLPTAGSVSPRSDVSNEASVDNEATGMVEEIIAVEESSNVESAMSFDFMDGSVDNEVGEGQREAVSTDVMSQDEKQRIREAKEKFKSFEGARIEPKQTQHRRVGKLKDRKQLQAQDSTSSVSDQSSEASVDHYEIMGGEEAIIAVEECANVESAISFDFMDGGEDNSVDGRETKEAVSKDPDVMSQEDKQRIREAKEKFKSFEKARVEPKPTQAKPVGKLRNREVAEERMDTSSSVVESVDGCDNVMTVESLDLQTKLEGIDTHHQGYDPEQERRMLEEAEAAFRSFKDSKTSDSRPKHSAKTKSLIKSFSNASISSSNQMQASKGGRQSPRQTEKSSHNCLPSPPILKEDVIEAEIIDKVSSALESDKYDKTVEPEQPEKLVINSGLVKQRSNIFSNTLPPQGEKSTTANVKKWIASHPPESSPRENEANQGSEISNLQQEIEHIEYQISILSVRIEMFKLQGRKEEALDVEEEFHAAKLELSKLKKKLLKIQKSSTSVKTLTRSSSSSSECHSVPDDGVSDRASSSGSRSQRGGLYKASRELQAPVEKTPPPVDVQSFNDDGEVVTEGNVISQIQTYEHESEKQRKERLQLRKSLSLSHSNLLDLENVPPMGFGGPEFAKDKSKLSKECKMPRDAPLPPVEYDVFNDEGEVVPEGNVVEQVKAFSKN